MSKEKEQIENTIERLQEVLDLFYQQNDKQAFEQLDKILDEITKTVDNLALYKTLHVDFELDEQKVYNILKDAMQALQADDKVLMADVFQYDFIEYLNELLENME